MNTDRKWQASFLNNYYGNCSRLFLQATINIVFDRVGKTDPVTRGIEITVNYLGIQFDVRFTHTFHVSHVLTPCCKDNY